MATEVKLPELGENIDSGNVVKLLVQAGQKIDQDQAVLELETDKATIEVPSPVAGTVKEILVQEGGKAQVGQTVLVVEESAETKAAPKKKSASKSKEAKAEEPPKTAEKSKLKEPAVEDTKETAAPAEAQPEEEEAVTTPSVEQEETPEGEIEIHEATVYHPATAAPQKVVPASPSVRRIAREIGIDIADVPGTGAGGRITVEDVKEFARLIHRGGQVAGQRGIAPALPDFSRWGQIERKPMSNIREKTAERMAIAWANVPQVTQFDKADVTRLEEYRKNFGAKAEAAGGKLTVTAVLIKVIASALKNFPQFNASLDISRKDIIYKKYYHLGVAVDTDRGLLVPVIRDVDRKNILQLSVELTQLAERARNRKLTLEEMQGGTFTITNLGGIGGTNFSPIVNFPEVAILGISRSSMEPFYTNGSFEPRTMLPLSLSYDHRIIDGADAARFLRWVCEAIRDPFLVALEG
ncbi:2-oxo acid dehydrogenase subunit E2 [bacterium]|nr:2-oxo acid dehydrogenase subunit E2 [bacterium]MCI0602361.1 2-oxo acid dehydrogenase subunit E2 [bacterium]